MSEPPADRASAKITAREARLAAQLRTNLMKRKAQAKARAESPPPPQKSPPGDASPD
jgi:hypothetical protein